jgi:hypothetical protein
MKRLALATILLSTSINVFGQKIDQLTIGPRDLDLRSVHIGNSTYIVYFKKKADAPAERITLVRINVEPSVVSGRKVFVVTQQWESADDIAHTSKTVHDANDFSTVFHETWWKRLGYAATFDFAAKRVDFKGTIDDAKKAEITADFNQSFDAYNLCWHSDLIIFPLLPYQNGRNFVIKFYDPGAGKSQDATYAVVGSESLLGGDGGQIDCWILEHKFDQPNYGSGTQRFWISKRTHEVLKEEDEIPTGYRYKLKIGVSGEK